ncbi:ThiF family adenylyltransferase [Streptomyces sp. NPDC051940]|uniref:HesA/MoeB/ThiF family protein n=1 Tax=Streptomyces sp. NPDC051940 TaxID=3155675 RepID=UPI0034278E69
MITIQGMERPRIKPEHRGYRTRDGHVRLGSTTHGIGVEIEATDDWLWTLVRAMDGSHSTREIVGAVTTEHSDVPPDEVLDVMSDLLDAGFVDDAGARCPTDLSSQEQERYGRGVALLRWMDKTPRPSAWEAQLWLRRARVLIVGTGGTGSAAARHLVASGVGHVHCVDPDVVELSNLNRQSLYREADIGQAKVDAAVRELKQVNSDVRVTGEQRAVRGADGLKELLETCPAPDDGSGSSDRFDLLVLAADDPPTIRNWANQVCLELGLPWVDGGYQGPIVAVSVFSPGRGACWECLRTWESEERDLRLDSSAAGRPQYSAPPPAFGAANSVTAGLSGGLLAYAAIALLTGIPQLEPGLRIGLNLMRPGEPSADRRPRRADCPACTDLSTEAARRAKR